MHTHTPNSIETYIFIDDINYRQMVAALWGKPDQIMPVCGNVLYCAVNRILSCKINNYHMYIPTYVAT